MIDLVLDLNVRNGDVLTQLTRPNGGETSGVAVLPKLALQGLVDRARPLIESNDATRLEELGQKLFSTVLPGALGNLWVRSYSHAEAHGLPIRLRVHAAHAAELQRVPWEILHDGKRCLSLDLRSSVVRFVEEPVPFRTFSVPPPLRVLVTTASPPGCKELDLDLEERMVREAYFTWGKLAVEPAVHHQITLAGLGQSFRRARLDGKPFHVWHHCGHGGFADGDEAKDFQLFLMPGSDGRYATVPQLTTLLAGAFDLRLAVLAVCHGGAAAGLAPALAKLNVPAVVGFPTKIGHRASQRFSRVLHECLRELPVEQAVSEARHSLVAHRQDLPHSCLPLLFSRRTDWGPLVKRESGAENGLQAQTLVFPGFVRRDLEERKRRARQIAAELDRQMSERGNVP